MKLPEGRSPQYFDKSWHRLALRTFVVCWTTMLVPMLLFPGFNVARLATMGLLVVGTVAILTIFVDAVLYPQRSRTVGLHEQTHDN